MLNGRRVKEGKSNRNEKLRCIDKMDIKKIIERKLKWEDIWWMELFIFSFCLDFCMICYYY